MFSVIIPFKGRIAYLLEAAASLQAQTFTEWECLLINDEEGADCPPPLAAIVAADNRVRYYARSHAYLPGANGARNMGASLAQYTLLIFHDADDVWAPDALERRAAFIHAHPGMDFWVFPSLTFHQTPGESDILWNLLSREKDDLARYLNLDMVWQTAGAVYSKPFFNWAGKWDEQLSCWQDWEMAIRTIYKSGGNYKKAWQCLPDHYYRVDKNGAISGNMYSIKFRDGLVLAIWKVYCLFKNASAQEKALLAVFANKYLQGRALQSYGFPKMFVLVFRRRFYAGTNRLTYLLQLITTQLAKRSVTGWLFPSGYSSRRAQQLIFDRTFMKYRLQDIPVA